MNNQRNLFIRLSYIALDVLCIYFVIFTSCVIRQKLVNFPVSFEGLLTDPANPFRFTFAFWIFATIFFMNANVLYQTRREISEGIEIWLVIKSVCLASLMTMAAIYSLKIYGFPRTVLLNATLGMMIVLSAWRVMKRLLVEYLVSHGYNNFNAVIIGAGKIGTALAQEIEGRPGLGIKIVGFLDDLKTGHLEGTTIKILGKISDFETIAQREFVNKVFITIHNDSGVFLKLLEQSMVLNVAVRVVPHGFDLTSGDFFKYNIGFIPILEYSDAISRRKQTGKRLFDFALSAILAFVLAPLFLIIAALIKFDSKGPVFYVSRRYGKGGKIFHMYKFRSMVTGADEAICRLKDKNEVDGPIFKIKKDPRVTKVGCFLRRYSLDELPQIFNVILGDMSLVGPRPLPIDQVEKDDFRQLKRLEVKPGITGLWQIRGRSDISFARLVKWDIWYINNWSFWLDLNILFHTIPVALKGKGAY